MDFYKRALELKDETVADRRYIHENAEAGLELPKTKAYVMDKLKEYGLDPVECGEGVTAMKKEAAVPNDKKVSKAEKTEKRRWVVSICLSNRKNSTYLWT